MKPHYMIVWKPLGAHCWTPVTRDFMHLHEFCAVNWSDDLVRVRKICQYLNGIGHMIWMEGLNGWDRAVFRVATITIADHEEVSEPSGERIAI